MAQLSASPLSANCAYCSYANGMIALVREVAARTERSWCPIKHARRVIGAHPYYPSFANHGDADAYREALEELAHANEPAASDKA